MVTCMVSAFAFAGTAGFRMVQSVTLPLSPSVIRYDHTPDFSFFLNSTKTDMVMADGNTGKILWQVNFQKAFNDKKFTNQFWNKDANVILLYDEDTKKGVAPKYFIDGKTGQLLWKSDKYVSDFGEYELSNGFQNYFDPKTKGVLLPTKEQVEFVNVQTGDVIWSKAFDITGKAKNFDCMILKNYSLVKLITGKDSEIFLSTPTGEEITNPENYYDRKSALKTAKKSTYVEIPDKNMYVLMKRKESGVFNVLWLGGKAPDSWKVTLSAYDKTTDQLLWTKEHNVPAVFDDITYESFARISYSGGKIFIEHDPLLSTKNGLTVIDVANGEKIWGCYYTVCENKGIGTYIFTPHPSPSPIIYNNKAFVVNKINNKLFCYNPDNGEKIWESAKFSDTQKIPSINTQDGLIILTFGAPAKKIKQSESTNQYCFSYSTNYKRVQCVGYGKNRKQRVSQYIYDNKDIYGLAAYDSETGKIIWDSKSIAKTAKDKFAFIASTQLINSKLYCATDKNFFALNPKTGAVLNSAPISKENVGKIWGMTFFEKQNQFVLNCEKGIVKVDAATGNILGSLKTPNVSGLPVSDLINADDNYDDYAIFTNGNIKKMEYKEFSSIDLQNMSVRGTHAADILFSDDSHFSNGGEKFYVSKGNKFSVYSIK